MNALPCPNCGMALDIPAEMSGATVACPGCGQHLLVPDFAPPLPSRSVQVSRIVERRFQPATTLLDIFDLKFEKYVTPLIIRFTWMAVLLFSLLWILVIAGVLLWSWLPEIDVASELDAVPRARTTIELPGWDVNSPPTEAAAPPWLMRRGLATLMALTLIGYISLMVLWIRVTLETVIVVFNIAKTLTAMDDKLAKVRS